MKILTKIRSLLGIVGITITALGVYGQVALPSPDDVGFIGDLANPKLTSVASTTAGVQENLSGGAPALDMAVDRANRRLYVLTADGLRVFDINLANTPATLTAITEVNGGFYPVSGGKALALSLDGRTAYIGGKGKVLAVNLYPESIYEEDSQANPGEVVKKGKSIKKAAFKYWRLYSFSPDRDIAVMGVHPTGERLIIVTKAISEKLNITNDLLRSDVGNGTRAELLGADDLPKDFGYITQLDISADVQTLGVKREAPVFSEPVNLRALIYDNGANKVALGIKGMAFSPDGNYLLLSAVGASTSRATAYGIMPTTDEGTGGIVVLDVRPVLTGSGEKKTEWVRYLSFIPTTEKGEKTDELRSEIRKKGWRTVHPDLQWARSRVISLEGQIAMPIVGMQGAGAYAAAVDDLLLLEDAYKDYGYMMAYRDLYPRDMVGASSVAINSLGNFGVATMQETNNLGLLTLSLSDALAGYSPASLPDFYIKTGTGKTINGFSSGWAYNWAYPQKVAFTSDDSRIYIGMAGGVPKADLTNKYGSMDARVLLTQRDDPNSPFKGTNPPPGYSLSGGVALKSPRLVATLHGLDADGDQFSNLVEAYNRWNSLRVIPQDSDGKKKAALISTTDAQITNPAKPLPASTFADDAMDKALYAPPSGIGYRLNFQGQPALLVNAGSRSAIKAIERLGQLWHQAFSTGEVTRPYFVVGAISTPGGGEIKNTNNESLQYGTRNGFQVNFPYPSTINGDAAHDFVRSNTTDNPRNNSVETTEGFDDVSMEKFIKLLLAEKNPDGTNVATKIELDPKVAERLKNRGINFSDSRFEYHGALNKEIKLPDDSIVKVNSDSRRDLDSEMCVSFSTIFTKVENKPGPTFPQPQNPTVVPGRVYYKVTLPNYLNRATMTLRIPRPAGLADGDYVVRLKDGTVLEFDKEYKVVDLLDAEGAISLWVDALASGDQSFGVEFLSPELDNVYSIFGNFQYVQWSAGIANDSQTVNSRWLANCDTGKQKPGPDHRTLLFAETIGFQDDIVYKSDWVPAPDNDKTKTLTQPTLEAKENIYCLVTAGTEAGTLFVHAEAKNNPNRRTRTIAIAVGGCGSGCASGNCVEAGKIDQELKDGVHFWISDGNQGKLSFESKLPGPGLLSPARLEYPYYSQDTRVILDASGSIRQVLTENVLMDIRKIDTGGYAIDSYARKSSPVFNPEEAAYSVGGMGSPVSTLSVLPDPKEGVGDNGVLLKVKDQSGTKTNAYRYSPGDNSWTLLENYNPDAGKAERGQSYASNPGIFDGTPCTMETRTITDEEGQVATKHVDALEMTPHGLRLKASIEDPDGANRITRFVYNDLGLVSSVVYPDGRWSKHEYDGQKRDTKRVEPWLGADSSADESDCVVTTYDYAPVSSSDDGTQSPDSPRTTIVKTKGLETQRTFTVYEKNLQKTIIATKPGAAWNDPTNLVSVTRYIPGSGSGGAAAPASLVQNSKEHLYFLSGGEFAGRVASTENPDGTMAMYEYSHSGGGEVTTIRQGVPSTNRNDIVDGTKSISKTNRQGREIASTTTDIASGLKLDERTAIDVDGEGRVRKWLYLDGSFTSTVYGCCGVDSEIDRTGVTTSYTYDSFHRVRTQTRLGITTRYDYDVRGRTRKTTRIGTDGTAIVVSRTNYPDRVGDTIESYDALDRLTRVTTAYNADGTTTRTTTLPDGFTQWEKSDRDGRLLETGGTAAAPALYQYRTATLNGMPCSVTRTIARVYDDQTSAYRDTEWTDTYTDMVGRTIRVATPDGAYADSFYNAKGQLVRSVDPDGVTTLFDYDARGQRTVSAVDVNRNGLIDYAGSDRVSRSTSSFATKSWDGQDYTVSRTTTELWAELGSDTPLVVGLQEQSLDGRHTWTTQFDNTAHQEVQYPATRDGSWTITATSPDKTSSVQEYTGGRLAKTSSYTTDSSTLTSNLNYSYDPHGRVQSVTDSRLGTTSYTYYDDDQVDTVTAPHPELTGQTLTASSFYNDRGLLDHRKLPDGTETFYTYTPQGQLQRTYGSQTYPVEYRYDSQGRMINMITWQDFSGDTGKATTTWIYDSQRGQLVSKRDHINAGPTYTYTASGRLKTRTWARLSTLPAAGSLLTTTYGYQPDGTLATVDYSDDTPDIAYAYYRHGQVQEVRDGTLANGAVIDANLRYRHAYTFTTKLRPDVETIRTFGNYQLVRQYETAGAATVSGRYTGFTLQADGATAPFYATSYAYDDAGRLKTVSALDPHGITPTQAFTYNYRTDASLIDTLTGPAHTVKYDYQPKGNGLTSRTNKVGETVISLYGYTLNTLGQRTAMVNKGTAFAQPTHFAYQYNAKGEVIAGNRFQGDDPANPGLPIAPESFAYNYDDIGNRKTASILAPGSSLLGSATYTPNLLNQYTGIVSESSNTQITNSPVYDADGNLTDDGRWTYTWNAENRLIAMEASPSVLSTAKQKLEFTYDYRGRRVTKKAYSWNTSTNSYLLTTNYCFLYDGWNLIAEYASQISNPQIIELARIYTWGLDLSGSLQGAGGVSGLLAASQISSGQILNTYYPAYDGNGNITQYLGSTGTIAAHFEYSPFGEIIRSQLSNLQISDLPFEFSTKYTDSETNLCYYGLRYYNPSTGRWINRDPIEEMGGPNTHAFSGNNLVDAVDALGTTLYVDGKKVSVDSAIGKMFVKGETSAEIIKQMVKAWEDFEFSNCDNLGKHVQFRIDAINLMIGANAGSPEINIGYTRLTPLGHYERGKEPFAPPPYWTVDPAGSYNYVASGSSYDAINAFIKGPTRLECLTAIKAIYLSALANNQGKAQFDKDFSTLTIAPQSGSSAGFRLATDERAIVPGDWVYFKNNSNYLKRHRFGYWQGENAMYMGGGKYAGLGVANSTVEEMRNELLNAYNQGLPDKQKISLKKIPKQPENIQRPTAFMDN